MVQAKYWIYWTLSHNCCELFIIVASSSCFLLNSIYPSRKSWLWIWCLLTPILYCKIHFPFHKNGNKFSPKCALLITEQMCFYFLAFTKQKAGKHLDTHMAAVAKGKRRYNLQTHLSTAILSNITEAKISIDLLTSSWYKTLKPRIKSMHRLKRTVLFISMMAQPQQVITGYRPDYIAFFFFRLFILIINCHLQKVLHRHQIKDLFLTSHRRLQNWLKWESVLISSHMTIHWGNFLILILQRVCFRTVRVFWETIG